MRFNNPNDAYEHIAKNSQSTTNGKTIKDAVSEKLQSFRQQGWTDIPYEISFQSYLYWVGRDDPMSDIRVDVNVFLYRKMLFGCFAMRNVKLTYQLIASAKVARKDRKGNWQLIREKIDNTRNSRYLDKVAVHPYNSASFRDTAKGWRPSSEFYHPHIIFEI